jgi:hypothetical protein
LGVRGEVVDDSESSGAVDDSLVCLVIITLTLIISTVFLGVEVGRIAIDGTGWVKIRFQTKDKLSVEMSEGERETIGSPLTIKGRRLWGSERRGQRRRDRHPNRCKRSILKFDGTASVVLLLWRRWEEEEVQDDLRVMNRKGTSEIWVAMTEEVFWEGPGPVVLRIASAPAASKGPFPTFGLQRRGERERSREWGREVKRVREEELVPSCLSHRRNIFHKTKFIFNQSSCVKDQRVQSVGTCALRGRGGQGWAEERRRGLPHRATTSRHEKDIRTHHPHRLMSQPE